MANVLHFASGANGNPWFSQGFLLKANIPVYMFPARDYMGSANYREDRGLTPPGPPRNPENLVLSLLLIFEGHPLQNPGVAKTT